MGVNISTGVNPIAVGTGSACGNCGDPDLYAGASPRADIFGANIAGH